MALEPGTRFGPYEIAESIGAGGMGEVYLARDTNLKRDVAIKVLPPAFVEDADRLARFQREAEILASLNHSNIAQVYGLEHADTQTAIAMELVEGPTLDDCIRKGPISPDEAMGIALQIVAALEAAHERQIVHRDLKPANVKVRADGTVTVLDFGISKPIDPTAISGGAVAATPAVTQTGVILGTAAYMSPEQAQGKFVDQRSDIWAFGCLLFEMLTGQPAFGGENVMAILARVIDRESDLSSMPATISPAVRHTIRLCLEKDPRKRIHHMGDVRLALSGRFESELPRDATAPARQSRGMRIAAPAVTLVIGAALMAVAGLVLRPATEPKPVTRFTVPIPPDQQLRNPQARTLAISADGRRIVVNLSDGLYVREFESLDAIRVPGTEGEVAMPSFGASGTEVEYLRLLDGRSQGERVSIDGGPATVFAVVTEAVLEAAGPENAPPQALGISRIPDGTYLVSGVGGVYRYDPLAGDGQFTVPIRLGENFVTTGARLLPDGDTVLFAMHERLPDRRFESTVVTASLSAADSDGEVELTTILPRASDPRYLASSGHLLFLRDQVIYAIAFDPEMSAIRGQPRAVLPGVRISRSGLEADYDVAANGTLAWLPSGSAGLMDAAALTESPGPRLGWLYPDGRFDILPFAPVRADPGALWFPTLSPDNIRLAATVLTDNFGNLYTYDLARGGARTLVGNGGPAVWMPDGEGLIFFRQDDGLFRRAADASSPEQLLLPQPEQFVRTIPTAVNSAGTELLFVGITSLDADGDYGIYRLPLTGNAEPEVVLDEPGFRESTPKLSPDGRYMAYTTTETGAREIHIRPYPDVTSRRVVVSTGVASDPSWDAGGEYLYYLEQTLGGGNGPPGSLMRVAVQTDPVLELSEPEPVTSGVLFPNTSPNYAHDTDADRWLVYAGLPLQVSGSRAADLDEQLAIVVAENWVEWLKQEVPN